MKLTLTEFKKALEEIQFWHEQGNYAIVKNKLALLLEAIKKREKKENACLV